MIRDICDVHKDVEYDFDFEECDSDGEGYKGDDVPDLMPNRPTKTGNEPRDTEWESDNFIFLFKIRFKKRFIYITSPSTSWIPCFFSVPFFSSSKVEEPFFLFLFK